MMKSSLVLGLCVVLSVASTATAQLDPPGQTKVVKLFDGEWAIVAGTRLVLQQEFSGELSIDLRAGEVFKGAVDERPYVSINTSKTVINPHTRKEEKVARTLARGAELTVTAIWKYRTAFDSGSYVYGIAAKGADGSSFGINLIAPESSRGFITTEQFEKAIGDIVQVKPATAR